MKYFTALFLLPFALLLNSCGQKTSTPEVAEIPEETVVYAENPSVTTDPGAFEVPALAYPYNALEPYIDARTMEIHHSRHHLAYTNNLNKAIAGTDLEKLSIEELLSNLDMNNMAVRNNGGGHYNHSLFWETMSPTGGGFPESVTFTGDLTATFGSFENFKEEFKKAALGRFGSGWAWLFVNKNGKLEIGSTANQDNPLMPGLPVSGTPILGLDVWEHAYYLNYQNKRADYAEAFFNVIDWEVVTAKYEAAKSAK